MQIQIAIDRVDELSTRQIADRIRLIADRIEGCGRTDDLFSLGYFYTDGTRHRSIADPSGDWIGEVSLNPD